MRDTQKGKVYKWEKEVCPKYDRSSVSFDEIPAIVNHVWSEMGLEYPPVVLSMPKQNRKALAKGDRNNVLFDEDSSYPTWIILHELAHSMTISREFQKNERHGPNFVGVYMKLLEKFLNIPMIILMGSANLHGVKFNFDAKPVFLDK